MGLNKVINLAYGNSPIIGQKFTKIFGHGSPVSIEYNSTNYLPHQGLHELITGFSSFVERNLRISLYNYHGIVTCGASGGLNMIAHLAKKKGYDKVYYPAKHYYMYSPLIFKLHGFSVVEEEENNNVVVYEIPSNPLGEIDFSAFSGYKVVDLTYFSGSYLSTEDIYNTASRLNSFSPDVFVFSFGKLSGFNNLHLGFAFFKNKEDYSMAVGINKVASLIPSGITQHLVLNDIQRYMDDKWNIFWGDVNNFLTHNRVALCSSLSQLPINDLSIVGHNRGMFVTVKSTILRKMLEELGVAFVGGESLGLSFDYCRLNLAMIPFDSVAWKAIILQLKQKLNAQKE